MSTFKTFMVLSVVFASVNAAGKSGKSQVFVENGSQIGCLNGAGKWVSSDSCATFDYHPNGGLSYNGNWCTLNSPNGIVTCSPSVSQSDSSWEVYQNHKILNPTRECYFDFFAAGTKPTAEGVEISTMSSGGSLGVNLAMNYLT